MNNMERKIHEILDAVVDCCSFTMFGEQSLTAADVLGPSKKANVNLTRSIFASQMVYAGYTTETIAFVLKRTEPAVRKMLEAANASRVCSAAYRIADAEATLRCKKIIAE